MLNLKSEPVNFGFKGQKARKIEPYSFYITDIGNVRSGLKFNVVFDDKINKEFAYAHDGIFLFIIMPAQEGDSINLFSRTGMRKLKTEFSKYLVDLCKLKKEAKEIRKFSLSIYEGALFEKNAALNIIRMLEKSLDDLYAIKDVKMFDKKYDGLSDIEKKYKEISKTIAYVKNILKGLEGVSEKIAGLEGIKKFEFIIYKDENFKDLQYLYEHNGFGTLKTLAENSVKIIYNNKEYKAGLDKIKVKKEKIEAIKNELVEIKKENDNFKNYIKKEKKLEELKKIFDQELSDYEKKAKSEPQNVEQEEMKEDDQDYQKTFFEMITDFFKDAPENIEIGLEKIKNWFQEFSIEVKKEKIEQLGKELNEIRKKEPTDLRIEYSFKEKELKNVELEFTKIKKDFIPVQDKLINDLKLELESAKKVVVL